MSVEAAAPVVQSIFGFFMLHAIAWVLGERGRVAWRIVLPGMALTLLLALAAFHLPGMSLVFAAFNEAASLLDRATGEGTAFVFGYLGGAPLPFEAREPGSGFVLAFRALPLALVVSALSSLLFHWGILQAVVRGFSRLLEAVMGVGGAVGLSAAANVFVGMVEAPLVVRPYIMAMNRSELLVMMTCGMATIAGTVMVIYASILGRVLPDALAHILIASVISTPAAIVVATLMVPPVGPATGGDRLPGAESRSAIDAVARGTQDGAALLIGIVSMLIVLIALVWLVNALIGMAPPLAGAPLSLQRMLGWVMAPLVWLAGVPWHEATAAGALMGTKTVLNEFIAYVDLARIAPADLGERSRLIMVYALCGFANFGSLGIMVGALSGMAPTRRDDIVDLAPRTVVAGTLATLIAGCVAGLLA